MTSSEEIKEAMTQEATERILEDIRAILAGLPAQESLKRSLRHPAHRRPAVMQLFLERIEELRTENPSAALQLAETARDRAAKLPKFFSNEAKRVRVRAYMVSGGIFRTLAMLEDAEACYIVAYYLLGACDYPASEEIELMGKFAFLRRDQRRFEIAQYYADRRLKIARAHGTCREVVRSLVHLGNTLIYDAPDQAVPLFREAIQTCDRERDPRYFLAACQALGMALCDVEGSDPAEIRSLADESLSLLKSSKFPSKADLLQCLWLSGKASWKLGQPSQAVAEIDQARKGLMQLGMVTYAAAASLDLAVIYLEVGGDDQVKRLARESYPLFRARAKLRPSKVGLN